ncbi:MAG: hypothetical protein IJ019_02540 [Alphaproteobacteria bacterium]|nr:hypothetical protein [Alphaproteobacteria bacterium]
MRKYFLLTAAALLTATNVYAMESADITATAEISIAKKLTCDNNINFGHLTIKEGNNAFTITESDSDYPHVDGYNLLAVEGQPTYPKCSGVNGNVADVTFQSANGNYLVSEDNYSDQIKITYSYDYSENDDYVVIGADLHIPENVQPGIYTDEITFSVIH